MKLKGLFSKKGRHDKKDVVIESQLEGLAVEEIAASISVDDVNPTSGLLTTDLEEPADNTIDYTVEEPVEDPITSVIEEVVENTIDSAVEDVVPFTEEEVSQVLEETQPKEAEEPFIEPDINNVLSDKSVYDYYRTSICLIVALGEFKDLYAGRFHVADLPINMIADYFVNNSSYKDTNIGRHIISLCNHYNIMKKVLISVELNDVEESNIPYAIENTCGEYILLIRRTFISFTLG